MTLSLLCDGCLCLCSLPARLCVGLSHVCAPNTAGVEVVEELHGETRGGASTDDDGASKRIAAYARAGTVISCLLDLDAGAMRFVVLDEDRRKSAGSNAAAGTTPFRVRAAKTIPIPAAMLVEPPSGAAGVVDGFTGVVSGVGRTPTAGSKDDVFDESVAEDAVFSVAVLLSDIELANSVPFAALVDSSSSTTTSGDNGEGGSTKNSYFSTAERQGAALGGGGGGGGGCLLYTSPSPRDRG